MNLNKLTINLSYEGYENEEINREGRKRGDVANCSGLPCFPKTRQKGLSVDGSNLQLFLILLCLLKGKLLPVHRTVAYDISKVKTGQAEKRHESLIQV